MEHHGTSWNIIEHQGHNGHHSHWGHQGHHYQSAFNSQKSNTNIRTSTIAPFFQSA